MFKNSPIKRFFYYLKVGGGQEGFPTALRELMPSWRNAVSEPGPLRQLDALAAVIKKGVKTRLLSILSHEKSKSNIFFSLNLLGKDAVWFIWLPLCNAASFFMLCE